MQKRDDSKIVCYCNQVARNKILSAIENGARSLNDLYDSTQAGVGPCGGSCRRELKKILEEQIQTTSEAIQKANESSSFPPEVYQAISLFNRRYYWETHEILETIWLGETGKDKVFYQGIIQAAAALYHVLNANPAGVMKLSMAAIEKLKEFSPSYKTFHIENLLKSLHFYKDQAKEILGSTQVGFDYKQLPMLTIGNEMSIGSGTK